jgi:DNA modification methylase
VDYSDHIHCIGKLDANEPEYYEAMEEVIKEIYRVLKDNRYMALYVSDSFKKGKPFMPIGFELFSILRKYFEPVDIVSVVRNNRTLKRNHWHTSAEEGNYFLRGFNYLFIMKKAHKGTALLCETYAK